MGHNGVTCESAAEWISLSLDDELSEHERAALACHLDGCTSCRELAARLAWTSSLLRSEPPLEPRRAIVIPVRPRRSTVSWRPTWRGAGAVATAAAALAAALTVFGGGAASSGALTFGSVAAQQRFADAHVRTEPKPFEQPLGLGTLRVYAERVLR
jgi:anti-sigma factor RsiW